MRKPSKRAKQRQAASLRARELELARRLRKARITTGFTQVEAAAHLHRQRTWVSKIERGARYVSAIELEEFA